MLKVCNLRKSYGSNQVLKDVNFKVHKGEVVGIIGINGAGKTTLFQAILGHVPVQAGTITVNGVDLRHNKEALPLTGASQQLLVFYFILFFILVVLFNVIGLKGLERRATA